MIVWILTILYLDGRLERACERVDKRIEEIALDPFGDTAGQFAKIAALIDFKRRLVNMQALSHRLRAALNADEARLAAMCLRRMSYAEIGAALGVSKATAYRKTARLAAYCADVLKSLGFTADRLKSDYADVEQVRRVYRHFGRRSDDIAHAA